MAIYLRVKWPLEIDNLIFRSTLQTSSFSLVFFCIEFLNVFPLKSKTIKVKGLLQEISWVEARGIFNQLWVVKYNL